MVPRLSRRGFLWGGLAIGAAGVAGTSPARASVARALRLSELVQLSRHSLVGTPVDGYTRWDTIGRKQRIVTYTLVRVEQPLDGRSPVPGEILVRTLGGTVGDIGQVVSGEAALRRGVTAALFLQEASRDVYAVTGMAQGHYRLQVDAAGTRRLRADTRGLELLSDELSAVRRLDLRTVGEVEALVFEEISRGTR